MAIDKIGSKALLDCSVAAADIAPGTITSAKLAGSIANAKLANNTITINGTATALGASATVATVAWQSVVVSDGSTVTTMVAGRGYFINNTSAAGIVKLPTSASAGDTIAIKDYAGNFGTNNLTIQRNSHKIQGIANDGLIKTNRASVVLVYIDATKGWLYTNESNVGNLENKGFISATGGTVTTSGDYKIHTFTGDGNFVVSSLGFGGTPCAQATKVSYVVVAGGGGTTADRGGAGGAGGFREGKVSGDPYSASPLVAPDGLTVAASTTYPITVGGGGPAEGAPSPVGGTASNSVFSTITSTAGGAGARNGAAKTGGSGGGGPIAGTAGGAGNTPPVSPPQGNNGGNGSPNSPPVGGGGGGGATAVGGNGSAPEGGDGGAGATTSITGSATAYAGGGGGGHDGSNNGAGGAGGGGTGARGPYPGSSVAATGGTANTGGGGGGSNGGGASQPGTAGGKGVVIIRYLYQ